MFCISCGTRPAAPPAGGFQLKGKVAVEDAGERFSASFLWRQDGAVFDIELWGPLGQGRVHLRGDAHRLAVLDGRGNLVREGPRDAVMQAQLGWSLPLDVLPAWVLGEPLATLPATELRYDAAGRLQTFEQLGWRVELAQFREVQLTAHRRWLPRRVDAHGAATRVRLIVADWQI